MTTALVGGRDVSLWTSKKLESAWSSAEFSYSISAEILSAITRKFTTLETQAKLGLLFSFAALKKQTLSSLTNEIREIFEIALKDDEEWVRICAQELQPILSVSNPHIELNLDNNRFQNIVDQLSKIVPTSIQFAPLEYAYLSSSLISGIPKCMDEQNHFVLSKSKDELLQELTQQLKPSKLKDDDVDPFDSSEDEVQPLTEEKQVIKTPSLTSSTQSSPFLKSSRPQSGFLSAGKNFSLGGDFGHDRKQISASVGSGFKPKGTTPNLTNRTASFSNLNKSTTSLPITTNATNTNTQTNTTGSQKGGLQVLNLADLKDLHDKTKKKPAEKKDDDKKRKLEEADNSDPKKQKKEKTDDDKQKEKEKRDARKKQLLDQKAAAPMPPLPSANLNAASNVIQPSTGSVNQILGNAVQNNPIAIPGIFIPQLGSTSQSPSLNTYGSGGNAISGHHLVIPQAMVKPNQSIAIPFPQSPNIQIPGGFKPQTNTVTNPTNSIFGGLPNTQALSLANPQQQQQQPQTNLQQTQQQPQQPAQPAQPPTAEETLNTIFQNANQVTPLERETIERFLRGEKIAEPGENLRTITLSKDKRETDGKVFLETVLFEMNFDSGTWRKLKRKKLVVANLE